MPAMDSFSFLSSASGFILFLLGFGFLILVHELGHFLVAKWVGVKVTQFSIGMGHAILTWRKGFGFRVGSTEAAYQRRVEAGEDPAALGETEYRLGWLPLGGYVKMLGQEDLDPSAAETDDPRSFMRQPIWARACILSAGVVMNMLFGALFFILAFMIGVPFPPAEVGRVAPGSPAAEASPVDAPGGTGPGLAPGDRVLAVNGNPVSDFQELQIRTALAEPGAPITLSVRRDGAPEPLTFSMTPAQRGELRLLSIGVRPPVSLALDPGGAETMPASLVEAGVRPGARIVAVDERPVTRFDQFEAKLIGARGRPVPVTFEQPEGGGQLTVELAARAGMQRDADGVPHLAGLVPATRISRVVPGSPAQAMGIEAGDLVAEVAGTPWPSGPEVARIIGAEGGGRRIRFELLRDGERVEVTGKIGADGRVGILMEWQAPVIARVLEQTPAAGLGVPGGSRIRAVAGEPVQRFGDVQRRLQAALDEAGGGAVSVPVEVALAIKGRPVQTLALSLDEASGVALREADWDVPPLPLEMERIVVRADNPIDATTLGIRKAHQTMLRVYLTLARLAQGSVRVEHLQGPVGITHTGTRVAQEGLTYLLFFLGLLSVNLAVLNFLPIPIVDGGHILFLVIEKLRGRPPGPKVQTGALLFGLLLLGSLFLVVTYHDVMRLVSG